MINVGHHVGINDCRFFLRNATTNRSEPVIPQGNVGPWNQTTIEENMRRGFEIGSRIKLKFHILKSNKNYNFFK